MNATLLLAPLSIRSASHLLRANDLVTTTAIKALLPKFQRTNRLPMPQLAEIEDAAEEVFDLTNNPSRQDERELLYGRGRSCSVGDVVEVEHANNLHLFLCCSAGWQKLD